MFVVVALLGVAGCLAESIVPDTSQQQGGTIRRGHGSNHINAVKQRRLNDRLLNINPNKHPDKIGSDNLNPNKQNAFINPNSQVIDDVELTGEIMMTYTPTSQPSDAPSDAPSDSPSSSSSTPSVLAFINDDNDETSDDTILMTIINDDGINDSLTTILPSLSKTNKPSTNPTTISTTAEQLVVNPNDVSTNDEDGEGIINDGVIAIIITNETTSSNQTMNITIPNNDMSTNNDDDGLNDEMTSIINTATPPISNISSTPLSNVSTAIIYPSTRFKLYWYWGIDWSPTEDLFYCMECSGTDGCYVGNNVYQKQCNNESIDQLFTVVGNTIRSTFDPSLCFTVMGYHRAIDTDGDPITTPIELQLCDENNSLQQFVGYKSSGMFELNPIHRTDRCLTAHHFPKSYEMIYPRDCINARIDHSSSYIAF